MCRMKPILHIPVGIPGCGKSTFSDRLDALCVSTDAFRASLSNVNDQSKNDQVFAMFHQAIGVCLRLGERNVFADATNLDSRSRENLREIVSKANASAIEYGIDRDIKTHLILFRNTEQAIKRNRARDRVVPADVMMRMIDKYERSLLSIPDEQYDYITEVSATR